MYRKIVPMAIAIATICCQPILSRAEDLEPTSPPPERIMEVAAGWRGVPYRYAGRDRNGIDCSHFVHVVYRQVYPNYEYRLAQDYLVDRSFVPTDTPQPGDIIAFPATRGMSPHVGIITDGEARKFIGSQSSTGVKETTYLPNTYWGKRPYKILAFRATNIDRQELSSRKHRQIKIVAKGNPNMRPRPVSYFIASNPKRHSSIFQEFGQLPLVGNRDPKSPK
jgi:hypothetical protein